MLRDLLARSARWRRGTRNDDNVIEETSGSGRSLVRVSHRFVSPLFHTVCLKSGTKKLLASARTCRTDTTRSSALRFRQVPLDRSTSRHRVLFFHTAILNTRFKLVHTGDDFSDFNAVQKGRHTTVSRDNTTESPATRCGTNFVCSNSRWPLPHCV